MPGIANLQKDILLKDKGAKNEEQRATWTHGKFLTYNIEPILKSIFLPERHKGTKIHKREGNENKYFVNLSDLACPVRRNDCIRVF